ncbi:hypothetical protein AVEN_67726-1 [Araneus ventricosus]|uniref:Uncharacterized protein n=1 Tax=Araneus ventricosus TaxID=182803 RepID=A0A4Y2W7G6_ARAVE|nr:hypothetical protein AVEN_67726-1 [Araneus ventricosus]
MLFLLGIVGYIKPRVLAISITPLGTTSNDFPLSFAVVASLSISKMKLFSYIIAAATAVLLLMASPAVEAQSSTPAPDTTGSTASA